MIAPSSTNDLLDLVRKSGIVREELFDTHLREYPALPTDAVQSAAVLVKSGLLTRFQAKLLLTGRYRGFKLGPYVVKEQIGQGGMGAVYLAEHETLRRSVALKVLTQPKKDANAKLTIERFQREARAAAALDHPNIVRMHDVGKHADIHYLAMEYVEGQTLEQILTSGGPITPSRAVEYIAQAAAGLQHAFEKGFIHRDIKPSNLMLAKDGTIKILDMGLARSFNDDSDKLTEVLDKGAVVGTADFISPEQAMNAPNIDIRSDIYNLGATLFTLITGKSPFSGNTTQKLLQHQLKDAPSLMTIDRTLPNGLAEVVGKMLQKKPERRYQTPAEVISALANWLPEHGAGRVMVGLSSTDLGSSGKLQNTLNEIAASGTRRLSGTRIGGGKKKPWALWGGVAAAVFAAIGIVVYAVLPSSTANNTGTPIASKSDPVVPNKTVAVASIPVLKAPPKTEPVAATVPVVAEGPKPIFQFDAKVIPKFKTTWKEAQASNMMFEFPKGIRLESWKEKSNAAFESGMNGNTPFLSVSNLTDAWSSHICLDLEQACECPLVEGKEYRFRVAYRTTTGTNGYFHVKNPQHITVDGIELTDSDGQWIVKELNWTRVADVPIRLLVGSHNIGAEHAVSISSIEVYDGKESGTSNAVERVVLSPDFSKYSLFRERGKLVPDAKDPGNPVWTSTLKTGVLPSQWSGRTYRNRSEGEWSLEKIDDEPAIGVRTASGEGSMMLFAPQFDTTSGKCQLVMTYRIETGNEAVSLRFKPLRPLGSDAWDIAKLASTDGQWVTKTFQIDLKGAKGGYFELHNADTKFLWAWIKNLTVTEKAVEASAPSIADGPVVSSFDFSTMKPGKFQFADLKFKDNNSPVLPSNSFVDCWKATSVAEFRVEELDGKTGLGMTNLNDDLSAQIHVKELGVLVAKKTYRVRVEYLTSNDAVGKINVRIPSGIYPVVNGITLTSTGGKWKTATFDFVQQDVPLDMQVTNSIVGEGNRLTIRKIEILETKSVATILTDGPSVYLADFGTMKPGKFPYVDLKFKNDAPSFPTGSIGHCWKPGSAAEFLVEEIDGKIGFGFANLDDARSGEIYAAGFGVLTPGKVYRVRMEYLTQNDGSGMINIRKADHTEFGGVELATTGGKWKTLTFDFVGPSSSHNVDLRVYNQSVGVANQLMFRKIELLETK